MLARQHLTTPRRAFFIALALWICSPLVASEGGNEPEDEWTPQRKADFAVQGEYEGQWTPADSAKEKVGVQVIARDDGKFDVVLYPKGLPGAGWKGGKKLSAKGTRQGDTTEIKGFEDERIASATIRAGTLTLSGPGGSAVGALKRVERKSPSLGARPPEGAIVLFDGKRNGFPGAKVVEDLKTGEKLLTVRADSEHVFRKDFRLHLEFRTPFKPGARGQGRGNSGVYLLQRYEIQVLDSFGLEGRKGECGAFYGRKAPDLNMCLPPGSWQTYDVELRMARFDDDGKALSNPVVTVKHNGVVIHEGFELEPRRRNEPPREGKLHLQHHDSRPVYYRNIWVVEAPEAEL